MRTYGQYGIARGAEIFAERWTPLIIRNLHLGCETFGEIRDGAPGLSPTAASSGLSIFNASASSSRHRRLTDAVTVTTSPLGPRSVRSARRSASGEPVGSR